MSSIANEKKLLCFHCGEECGSDQIQSSGKYFCCEGCRIVFRLLDNSGLCEYYSLNETPGANRSSKIRADKFAYLDDPDIRRKLILFENDQQTNIRLHLPQIHCSSCLYLLENLRKLDSGVLSCRINFPTKDAEISFDHHRLSLRELAELLTDIGYEPYISLNEIGDSKVKPKKTLIYQLGVAGFCFGNIMLLSFPEYLGLEETNDHLQTVFRILNLVLSLPVFFYSAAPFFKSGWDGIRNRFLNIDAPIALAVLITFIRSVYEIGTGKGAGFLDSMSGIVFFMLAGRVLQDKAYQQLSFERDYSHYFPVAVTVITKNEMVTCVLPDIKVDDTVLIHNEEIIPADGILTKGQALIDYSFVTGESLSVVKEIGEIIYAGGKQKGSSIEMLVIKEVSQSYLTSLWSGKTFEKGNEKTNSFVHHISRYFTLILLNIALATSLYWLFKDPSKTWDAVTSILIVACPCALLLSNSVTNGNILRILGRNGFYLREAQVIEDIANIGHVVFDKTGTLTTTAKTELDYQGKPMTQAEMAALTALASQSSHPFSKAIVDYFQTRSLMKVTNYREIAGSGLDGLVNGEMVAIGSEKFITGKQGKTEGSSVYIAFGDTVYGSFSIRNKYRKSVAELVSSLKKKYRLSLISGDNSSEKTRLQVLLGEDAGMFFYQGPENKLDYIKRLQTLNQKVMMIGDGLNDAGALKQSDVGIAVAENSNNFTPASDAIIDAKQLSKLNTFIRLCRTNRNIVTASFVISILYNLVGLFFAVQGLLSPLIAAILMPASSLSILLITFAASNLIARRMNLL